MAPFGFDLMYEAQNAILNEQILPRIILSDAPSTGHQLYISSLCEEYEYNIVTPTTQFNVSTGEMVDDTGEFIAMITLRPFIQVDSSAMEVRGEETVKKFLNSGYCEGSNIKELLKDSIINFDDSDSKKLYVLDYSFLLSTIVGIIVVLIFAGFCLDAALRTIKLYFLQIIAPVPIMSYIDPSSSKKGLFSKWIKEVGLTWADLFIRLAAVYFAIFIISNIQFNTGNTMVNLLLILGALMFAKKLPDILKKMFNIDLKGDFKLNPFKKFQENALGGKQIMGAATGVAGGALGLATSFRGNNFKERFKNAGKGLTSGLKGGYKNPSTLKGLGSGMAPYRELRKKEKEEQNKAKAELKQYDKFDRKGQKLVENAFERDENGELITENGKYKVQKDKYFTGEFKDSYNNVAAAKTAVSEAERNYEEVSAKFDRINNNSNISEDSEIYKAALKAKNDARENMNKAKSAVDTAKERHNKVRKIYTDQAEIEDAMKEYMDKHPDALKAKNVGNDTAAAVDEAVTKKDDISQEQNKATDSESADKVEEKEETSETEEETAGKSYIKQAQQNTIDDLANGVDQVFEESDYVKEAQVNGQSVDEYNKSMQGDTSIFDIGKKVADKTFDKITADRTDESETYHKVEDRDSDLFDERGTVKFETGADFNREYLERTAREREERERQEQQNNQRNFGSRIANKFKRNNDE